MKHGIIKLFTIILILLTAITYITGKLNMDKKTQAYKYAEGIDGGNPRGPYEKLKNGGNLNMLVLTDDMLNNGNKNISDDLSAYFREKYGSSVTLDKNVTSGNNVFTSLMSLDGKKFDRKYDLILMDFGTYDHLQYDDNAFYGLYDSLMNKLYKSNPDSDMIIVVPYGVNAKFSSDMDKLNGIYGFTLIKSDKAFTDSKMESSSLFKNNKTTDQGYKVLTSAIEKAVQNNVESDKKVISFKDPKDSQNDLIDYSLITSFNETNGYVKSKMGNDTFYKSKNAGDVLSANVKCKNFALSYLTGPDCGKMDVYIDHQYVKTIDTYSKNYELKYDFIKGNLSDSVHRTAIQLSNVKNNDSSDFNIYIKNYIALGSK